MTIKRKFHVYKREFGATQKDLIQLYYKLGKSLDEMQDLLKPIPRASIRGRLSELRRQDYTNSEKYQIVNGEI